MSRRSFSLDKPEMDNTEDLTGFNVLHAVTQVTGGVLCVLVLVWSIVYRNGFSWGAELRFNWHPLLLTIGMVFLYANSMTIFRSLRNMNKKQLKYFHTAIHTTVLVTIIIGLWAIISLRIDSNHPHFRSLHSWVGIAATVVFFMQWLIGIITYLYPGLPPAWRSGILPLHVYFGIAGFILAIAGCITGFLEMGSSALRKNNGELIGEGLMINMIGLLFMIYGLLAVYIVTKSSYKRHPRSND